MFKTAGVVVVAGWLAVIGYMTASERADVEVARAGSGVSEDEEWLGVYLKGDKVGYAHHLTEKLDDGYRVTEYIKASFNMMGTVRPVEVDTVSYLNPDLALSSFEYKVGSADTSMLVRGVVNGRTLRLDINTGGTTRKQEMALKDVPHLSSDLGLILEERGLAVGDAFDMPFFDPSSMSEQDMKVTVASVSDMKLGGELLPVYEVVQEFAGVRSVTWFNPDYGMVKSEGPMGFTLLRETREQAMSPPEEGFGSADLISMFSVPVMGVVPDPRNASYIRVRVTGADMSGLRLDGGRQKVDGETIAVTKEDLSRISVEKLPMDTGWAGGSIGPTATVQSDAPEIAAQARAIVGGETDALEAARKLSDWVHGSLEKLPSAGVPSALEVLENRYGDCNEHTVLFTALARAAGIPARMCAGLAMLDGRFYYHAWPEVYVGEWVAIDPTFGQFPADAAHLRLVYGGPDKQINIMKLVGNIEAEVVESR